MSSEQDQDTIYSGAKIEPLYADVKWHAAHDSGHGVIGEERYYEQSHGEPLHSRVKHHHAQMSHADSQGVVGREEVLQGSKIAPLDGGLRQATQHTQGLDDEAVDAARLKPLGGVRED